jgi:lysophospholipase L1-like esterase
MLTATARKLFCYAAIATAVTISGGGAHSQNASCAASTLATQPAPPNAPQWLQRHVELTHQVLSKYDIVMVGDSITQMWPSDILSATFAGKRVLDFGVASDRTQNVIWRLMHSDLGKANPSEVYLLVGTNNLSSANDCDIVAGIQRIIELVESAWPNAKVYVLGILPRKPSAPRYQPARIDRLNSLIRDVTQKVPATTFVDTSKVFQCPDGYDHCALFRDDGLHPSRPGYEVFSQFLKGIEPNGN